MDLPSRGGRAPGSQANGSFPKGTGRLSEKSPAGYPHLTIGTTPPGARASRPHAVPSVAAQFPCDVAADRPAGGNRMGPAEAEAGRRCRLIPVEEMAEAAGGFVRAGRPRSRGDFFPLLGWGDGRVGAGGSIFFPLLTSMHRMHRIFQETASLYSWVSAIPHRTIARAGFRCNNLSSCLSCASCASMLIIRLAATPAVEAAPSRFVFLRGSSCPFVDISFHCLSFEAQRS